MEAAKSNVKELKRELKAKRNHHKTSMKKDKAKDLQKQVQVLLDTVDCRVKKCADGGIFAHLSSLFILTLLNVILSEVGCINI